MMIRITSIIASVFNLNLSAITAAICYFFPFAKGDSLVHRKSKNTANEVDPFISQLKIFKINVEILFIYCQSTKNTLFLLK